MSVPRGLSDAEQAAWARLADSVTPLKGKVRPAPAPKPVQASPAPVAKPKPAPILRAKPKVPPTPPVAARPARIGSEPGLDGHWNRKLKAGQVAPDFTLDLHGVNLDGAYTRIMSGLDQARAMGARVVLVIAGRERPVDPADRAERRGAIRAKLLDWLAASHHADSIAAVRKAHQRHGGSGALYLVLKRSR